MFTVDISHKTYIGYKKGCTTPNLRNWDYRFISTTIDLPKSVALSKLLIAFRASASEVTLTNPKPRLGWM